MKKSILLAFISIFLILYNANSQEKFLQQLDNFTFSFYIDSYYLATINKVSDTTNIQRFAGNSKFINEFRINIASLAIKYNTENIRTAIELQFGDNPYLLTQVESSYIKHLSYAKLGYRIVDDLWIDIGYLPDPVGIESSKPVNNHISSVSIGAYYQPDNFIGFMLSYPFSKVLSASIYAGNPFTLANGKNKNMNAGVQLTANILDNLSLAYTNLFGDQSNYYDVITKYQLYNNFTANYKPVDKLLLQAQFDYIYQKGSFDCSCNQETAYSGFVLSKFNILDWLSIAARYEFFNDNTGFLTGNLYNSGSLYLPKNHYNGYGLNVWGASASIEFIPYTNSYFRVEYRYNQADKEQLIFVNNNYNDRNYLLFTTGIKL